METAFDWITVAIFAGLVTHFLAHSAGPDDEDISLLHYLVPSAGCGVANWLGNHGWTWPALGLLIAVGAYAYRFLGPARRRPPEH